MKHMVVSWLVGPLAAVVLCGASDPAAVSPHAKMRGVEAAAVRWTGGFWAEKFELCRRAMLPSIEAALLNASNSEQLINFKIAAGLEQGDYRGTDWSDGDCHKWLEALAHLYAVTKDPALDRKMDEWIAIIVKAQAPDGYLSTNIQLNPKKQRWEKVQHHALYNMGHLISAACAHKQATGKDTYLNVARKTADYLYTVFAPRPPALARMDFNPAQMMALVELYRVTGERRYLELADVFITMRGSSPATAAEGHDRRHQGGTDLSQDRVPLRTESQAVGHAVCGTYLWCGAADLYMETGEPALLAALGNIWRNAAGRRTYITGGACALPTGQSTRGDEVHEAFGADYQLPNRTAYNETCADIGNAMWNWRLLQITGDARYADVVETVLYNSALSAVAADGRGFFYANPLEWSGQSGWPTKHFTASRWFLHTCYCCPPQVARTLAGLGRWAYSVAPEAVWVHLYGGNTLCTKLPDGAPVALTQQTAYPWDGHVKLTITQAPSRPCSLNLRIPGWAEHAALKINGVDSGAAAKPGTYATLRRVWMAGDVVELDLPLEPRLVTAHPAVEDCRGCVAVRRGPVVYCWEVPRDAQGEQVWKAGLCLPANAVFTPRHEKDFLGGVTVLAGQALAPQGCAAFLQQHPDGLLPVSLASGPDVLYRALPPAAGPPDLQGGVGITLIPYFAWANRGPALMKVWLPLVRPQQPQEK